MPTLRAPALRRLLSAAACLTVAASLTASPAAEEATSAGEAGKEPAQQTPARAKAKRPLPLDINTASKEALMKLPGIDEAYANRIIAARPYKAKSELLKKGILPQGMYTKVAAKITTAPPGKARPGGRRPPRPEKTENP